MSSDPSRPSGAWSDQALQQFIASVQEYALFMLDPQGRITSWNKGAQLIKGYAESEVIGRPYRMLFPDEDVRAGKPDDILRIAAETGRFAGEGWRLRKDGSQFWASVVVTAIRNDAGDLLGFGKVTRDMTDQHQANMALRLSEERFRVLVDGVRDYAIFMVNPSGIVTTWNSGAERIKGYTAGEIIGQSFERFYPPEDVAAGKPAMELASAAAKGRYEEEGWRVRKDGLIFWAHVIITPLRDPQGHLTGFAKVTRDLTERRLAEENRFKLMQTQEMLRLRDEFLSMASHELRTPVTAVSLQLELMTRRLQAAEADRPTTAQVLERLEVTRRQVVRLTRLIEDMLDVTRMQEGFLPLRNQRADLVEMASRIVDEARPVATEVASTLVFDAPEPVVGCWDPDRIEQVLLNLLSNAMRYARGRPIRVGVGTRGTEAVLTVSDEGPGIPAAEREHIFQRFARLGSSENFGGLGLGLWICRELVTAMGGTIQVESQEGHGATFTVRLPLASAAKRPVWPADSGASPGATDGCPNAAPAHPRRQKDRPDSHR
jgi:PAS domain S-box-containing protein